MAVIHYHITLFRASSFYTHVLIWPAILITIASFAVFLSHLIAASDLGLVSSILAMEVMKVVIDNFVPSCGELLWADLFTNMNEVFCFLALFESTIVIYIYHYNKESIVPGWLLQLFGCKATNLELSKSMEAAHKRMEKMKERYGSGGLGERSAGRDSLFGRPTLTRMASTGKLTTGVDLELTPHTSLGKMIFRALNRPFSPPGMGIDKDDDDDDDDDDDAVGPSKSPCARRVRTLRANRG